MATNLALDDRLIIKAQKLGNHTSKKEAVNAALREYVQAREQMKILSSFGKIEFDEKYNYKLQRAKR